MILIVLHLDIKKITGQTGNSLSNFWRTLEIPLINCEIEIF